jgi:AbiTii
MSLSHDIIAACADNTTPLATILRKCLILAAQLKSDELKDWAAQELEGYEAECDLPRYRILRVTAKGLFLGGLGAQINDQPLPSSILKKEHRHWATTMEIRQGVASLGALAAKDPTGSALVNWPADMVAHYQSKFIQGYALNRAWLDIPIPALVEILDTVRTRVLKFMLELQGELGDLDKLVASKRVEEAAPVVQNIFNTTVHSGTAIVASQAGEIDARTQTVVVQGDFDGLVDALHARGIDDNEIRQLETALKEDGSVNELAKKTGVMKWIIRAAKKIANTTGGVAVDVAKASLTTLVSSYLGLPPPNP